MLADSVDPDQIALEQYDQGLHCLPVILLNVNNSLIPKCKENMQVVPFKGNLKTTLSWCLLAEKNECFLGCTRLTLDTCTKHQRKYQSVILITIIHHKSSEYWGR